MRWRIIGGWICMLVLLVSCQREQQKVQHSASNTGTDEKMTFSTLVLSTLDFSTLDTASIRKAIKATEGINGQNPNSARDIYKALLQRSEQLGYRDGIILSILGAGKVDIIQGDYEKGVGKFLRAIQYCDTVKEHSHLARLYNNLGSAYNAMGKFQPAMQAYYRALSYERNGTSYNNLASLLGELGQYEKALKYIDTALPFAIAQKDTSLLATLWLNKGNCYAAMNKKADANLQYGDSASKYTDSGVQIARQYHLYRELSSGLINLGFMQMERHRSQEALNNLLEAVSLSDTGGIPMKQQVEALSNIGDMYLQMGQNENAERYLLKAWEHVNTHALPKDILFLTERLSALYGAEGNYSKAYAYLLQANVLKDSLQGERVVHNVNELETKYRTAQKDKELAINKLLISEQEKSIAKDRVLLLSITVSALAIIMLLSWRYLYKNRKERSERAVERIKAIMEGEDKERSRLAHDLHDGVNSQLTAVKSFLLAVQKEHPYLGESRNFNHAKQMLTETASDIRKVVHNLVPDDLIQRGLATVVEDFCASIFTGKEMNTDVQVYGDFKGISISLSLTIYRLVQELLHNVLKHANATTVTVLLSRIADEISLIVEDNGVGIPDEILNNSQAVNGIGLSGLKDRVKSQNGSLSIESAKGKGTVVSITFQVYTAMGIEKVSRY